MISLLSEIFLSNLPMKISWG